MGEQAKTRASLLLRVRDRGDLEAWSRFVDVYGPLVHDYGRRHGLQDADAADLTQEVLATVAGAIARFDYDPGCGPFRCWLFTVARTRRLDLAARLAKRPQAAGDSATARALDAIPDRGAEAEEEEWARASRRRLFEWASGRVRGEFREQTWQAFWRTAVGGEASKDVARDLGMSTGAVYMAKGRVLERLRREIDLVDLDFDEDDDEARGAPHGPA
jgi:RNA polymerase sigma-70 factor (ECF subfamily)